MDQVEEALQTRLVSNATDVHFTSDPRLPHVAKDEDLDVIKDASILTSDMDYFHSTSVIRDSGFTSSEQIYEVPATGLRSPLEHIQDEDSQADVEFDEDDLSPFDYARYHRLTTDYYLRHPLQCSELPSPGGLQAEVADPESTLSIGLLVSLGALKGQTTHERWDVDKEAAQYLASALSLGQEQATLEAYGFDCPVTFTDLKLEEPILVSDPDLDLARVRRRNTITISTNSMRPFKLDENQGEGLPWQCEHRGLPADKYRSVAHEKLDIDQDTMKFLKEISVAPPLDDEELTNALYMEDKVRFPTPETPPLMPLSPPIEMTGMSAAAGALEFASTPEDLIAVEAADLERGIMEQDRTPPASVTDANFKRPGPDTDIQSNYSPLRSLNDRSSSPFPLKRLKDLKADVPLTPLDAIEPPAKKAKTVSFPEELSTMIPSAESDVSIFDPEVANQDLDSFVADVVEPFANLANDQVANEQLVELDTTMRVNVPSVEDIELIPPWEALGQSSLVMSKHLLHKALLLLTKRDLLESETKWGGVSKLDRLLAWSPFQAKLGKVELHEEFDDGSLARYMAELAVEDEIDLDSLITQPFGLGAMEEDNKENPVVPLIFVDDEESEQASAPGEQSLPPRQNMSPMPEVSATKENQGGAPARLDMQSLLKKRKLELEAANKPGNERNGSEGRGKDNAEARMKGTSSTKLTRYNDLAKSFGGLSGFMQLHNGSVRNDPPAKHTSKPDHRPISPTAMIPLTGEEVIAPQDKDQVLPTPILARSGNSASIVLSSILLADRGLVRLIQDALPEVELVERDPIPLPSMSSDKKQNKGQEAEITVSPGVGIIMTTLQKMKQKPLPGQSTFFGIYDRIVILSQRYKKLTVLVSGAQTPTKDGLSAAAVLDDRDTEALSDLVGFLSTLDSDVEVYYVGCGEQELAKWLAASISHNLKVDNGSTLLQDETLWERFLRTAGLDPFATQDILAKLKVPEIAQGSGSSSIPGGSSVGMRGLAAFIQMTSAQRVQGFGQNIGETVLQRVNEVVDREWMSLAAKSTRR